MKRIIKWVAIILGGLIVLGFLFFLYFIPPFTLAPPSTFIEPEMKAGPDVSKISDEGERLLAQRGEYLVKGAGCSACHVAAGDGGAPNFERFLAGGVRVTVRGEGAAYSANLTPDSATGLGKLSRQDIVRILRTGQLPEGRILADHQMPWTVFSHYSEEDLYAIATYLKALKPVVGKIPKPEPEATIQEPGTYMAVSVNDHTMH